MTTPLEILVLSEETAVLVIPPADGSDQWRLVLDDPRSGRVTRLAFPDYVFRALVDAACHAAWAASGDTDIDARAFLATPELHPIGRGAE